MHGDVLRGDRMIPLILIGIVGFVLIGWVLHDEWQRDPLRHYWRVGSFKEPPSYDR